MLYYFVEFAGSFANIALLLLFIGRLFPKKEPVSRWFYASYVALLIAGQCALSLFPDWVTQRTIYLLVGGFLLALLFYEVRPWQAVFASGAFFTLAALVEVFAMLLIGLRCDVSPERPVAGKIVIPVFSISRIPKSVAKPGLNVPLRIGHIVYRRQVQALVVVRIVFVLHRRMQARIKSRQT